MKKVVKYELKTIKLSELTGIDMIGIEYSNGGRGQIVKVANGHYISVSPGDQVGKYVQKVAHKSIKDFYNTNRLFVFDDKEEFINWLLG